MIAIPIIIPTISPFGIDGNLQILDACCTCNHKFVYHLQQTTAPDLTSMSKNTLEHIFPYQSEQVIWNKILYLACRVGIQIVSLVRV